MKKNSTNAKKEKEEYKNKRFKKKRCMNKR
jgi:hypothetical protein